VVSEPPDGVADALRALIFASNRFRAGLARSLSLGLRDAGVLSALNDLGGQARPSVLAETLYLSSGTLTPILERLERSELILRTPHPTDGRATLVTLQAEGRRVSRHAMSAITDAATDFVAQHPEFSAAQLAALLRSAAVAVSYRADHVDG